MAKWSITCDCSNCRDWRRHDTEGAGPYRGPGCSNRSSGRRRRPGPIARGIATAGIVGAIGSTGFSADAVSGDVEDAKGIGEGWKNSAAQEQRNNQARGHRQNTTYKGRQRGGSGEQG